MISRKQGLGAVLAIALCVGAFGAANASAMQVSAEQCLQEETGTPGGWLNSSCTVEVAEGEWHKVPFGHLAGIAVTNPSAFTLAATVAGVKFSVKCSGLAGEVSAEDVGEEILGSTSALTFSGCAVTAPAGKECQVKAGGESNGKLKTNSLKSVSTRTAEKPNAFKTKFSPTSGAVFMTIEINGCTSTALNGSKEISGSAAAFSNQAGMLQEFSEMTESELKLGGQPVLIAGTYELFANGGAVSLGP